jgi:predicted small secreted protein
MIRKLVLILVLIMMVFWFSGCQTMAGLGGDIKWSAETTSDLLEGQ